MTEIFAAWPQTWLTFLLVLGRCTGLIVASPVMGSTQVPRQVRVVLTLCLALALATPIKVSAPAWGLDLTARLAGELLLGLAMGYMVTLMLAALQLGGELMDYTIGLGFLQIVDPLTNENTSVLAGVKFVLGALLFVVINGHLMVLRTLGESFQLIPPGMAGITPAAAEFFARLGKVVFLTGVQITAPLYISMLAINALEGILARTVPQVNILVAGFPVRILVGMLVVMLGIGGFFTITRMAIDQEPLLVWEFLGLAGGH